MLLSVIVPSFNIEPYLDRCLSSLRDQDLGANDYEIIVVDDGSTDDSLGVARRHEAADQRVRVFRQANNGVSVARNHGLDQARGKYVYFVDGDDYVARGSLSPVVDAMRAHSLDLGWIDWRLIRSDDNASFADGVSTSGSPGVSRVVDGISFFAEELEYPTSAWLYLVDREFLLTAGVRFDVGRLRQDQLFTAQVLAAARRVASVRRDVYRYVQRPGSILRSTDLSHNRKLLDDSEHLVFALEELRRGVASRGASTTTFEERLSVMQEGYVFFLITRIVRTMDIPLRPTLPDTLSRMRVGGFYPLQVFPGREHRSLRFWAATTVFNHRALLYPFAYAYRASVRMAHRFASGR